MHKYIIVLLFCQEEPRLTLQVGRETHLGTPLRVVVSEPETLWHKLDHLLYLPILNLTRPRDLYYCQGDGLRVLYGFILTKLVRASASNWEQPSPSLARMMKTWSRVLTVKRFSCSRAGCRIIWQTFC